MIDLTALRLLVEAALIGFTALFALFLAIRHRTWVVALLAPLVVVALVDGYQSFGSVLGTSTRWALPVERVEVISAYTTPEWIHLWYVNPSDKTPRAIKLTPSEANKAAAARMRKRLDEGQKAYFQLRPKEGSDRDMRGYNEIEYEAQDYTFNYEGHSQKNPEQR